MKTVAIIQARMSSTRLEGKVLLPLRENELVLDSVFNRIIKSKTIDEVVIATSIAMSDDEIEIYCKKKNYPVVRGSLEDVLERFYFAAMQYNADIIVRVTADSPLIDFMLNDSLMDFFSAHKLDYAGVPQEYLARGISTEIFNFDSLERTFKEALAPHREHVTSYMYTNPHIFKCLRMDPPAIYRLSQKYRLTLDTQEDYQVIKSIFTSFDAEYIEIKDVIEFLQNNPNISKINSSYIQKGL